MRQSRIPESACPHCGYHLNGATDTQGVAPPASGCFSVCIACAGLVRFNDDLTLRKAYMHEALAIHPELCHTLQKVQLAVRQQRAHPGWPGGRLH